MLPPGLELLVNGLEVGGMILELATSYEWLYALTFRFVHLLGIIKILGVEILGRTVTKLRCFLKL